MTRVHLPDVVRRRVARTGSGRGRHRGRLGWRSWLSVGLLAGVLVAGAAFVLSPSGSAWASGSGDCVTGEDYLCLQGADAVLSAVGAGDVFEYDFGDLRDAPKTVQVLAEFPDDSDAVNTPTLTIRLRNVVTAADLPGFEPTADGWTYTGAGLGAALEGVVVDGLYTPDVETLTYGAQTGTGTSTSTTLPTGTVTYTFAEGTTSAAVAFKVAAGLAFGAGAGTVDSALVPGASPHTGAPIVVSSTYQDDAAQWHTVRSAEVTRIRVTDTPSYHVAYSSPSATLTADSGPVTQRVTLVRATDGLRVTDDDAAVLDRTFWLRVACEYADWAITDDGGYQVSAVGGCQADGWQHLEVRQRVHQAPTTITVTFTYSSAKASGADHVLAPALTALDTQLDGTGGITTTVLDGSTETTSLRTWGATPTLTVGGYQAPAFTVTPLAQGPNEVYADQQGNWLDAVHLENTGSADSGPLTVTVRNDSPGTVGVTAVTIRHPAAQSGGVCGTSACGLLDVTATTSDAAGNPSGQRTVAFVATAAGATSTKVTVTGLGGTSAQYLTSLTFTYARPWPVGAAPTSAYSLADARILVQGTPLRPQADYVDGMDYQLAYTLTHPYRVADNTPLRVNGTLECGDSASDSTQCTVTSQHELRPAAHTEVSSTAVQLSGLPDYLNAGDAVSGVTVAYQGTDPGTGGVKYLHGIFHTYLFEHEDVTVDPSQVEVTFAGSTVRADQPGGPFSITKRTYQADGTTFAYYDVASTTPVTCRVSSSTLLAADACPRVTYGFQVGATVSTTVLPAARYVAFGVDGLDCLGGGCVADEHDVATASWLGAPSAHTASYNFRAALDLSGALVASTDDGLTYGSGYDVHSAIGTTLVDAAALAGDTVSMRVVLRNVSGAPSTGTTHVWIPVPKQGESTPYTQNRGGCDPAFDAGTPEGPFNTACDLQAGPFEWSLALDAPVSVTAPDAAVDEVSVGYATTNSAPDAAGSHYAWATVEQSGAGSDYRPWAGVDAAQVRMVHVAIDADLPADAVVTVDLPLTVPHSAGELLDLAGATDLLAARVYRSVPTYTGYATTAPVRMVLRTGVVAGQVFLDADRSGARTTGDEGWPGAVVQAFRAGTAVGDPVTSDDQGRWAIYLDSLDPVDVRFTLLVTPDPSGEPTTPSARFHPDPGLGVGVTSPTPAADQAFATTSGVYPSKARGATTGTGTSAYQFDDVDAAVIRPTLITLVPEGGRFVDDSTTRNRVRYQYLGGVVGSSADAVTRVGHTLAGWGAGAVTDPAAAVDLTTTPVPRASTTYHAVWVPVQAPVTLDANGGTVAGWDGATGESSQTRAVAYGSTVQLPTPTRDGQVFVAWCTSRSGSGVLDGCTTYVPGSMAYTQTTTAATTLYAKWRTATFALSFALAGGTYRGSTTPPAGTEVLYGASATDSGLTWPDPADLAPPAHADPYVFAGWYTTQAGVPVARVSGGTALTWANLGGTGVVGVGTSTDHTLVLTARWVHRGALVVDPAGGTTSGALPASGRPDEGSTVSIAGRTVSAVQGTPATAAVGRLGYRFTGWTEQPSGATVPDGDYPWTGDRALFGWQLAATWQPLVGDLHLHDASTVVDVPGAVTFGQSICAGLVDPACPGALPTPTRAGAVFTGWKAADGTVYAPGVTAFTDTTGLTADSTALGDLDLVAQWRPVEVVIDFDARGGSAVGWSSTVALGSSPSLTGALTSRTGYDFAGWWLPDGDPGTEDDDPELTAATVWTRVVPDGTHVLAYARWVPRTYTLRLDALGGTVDGPDTLAVTYGATYGPLPGVTRTGYRLTAWRTGYDPAAGQATGAAYAPAATGTWGTPDNLTLYAEWEPVRTTLVLHAGDDASVLGQPTALVSVTYGAPVTDLPVPSRAGHEFLGWWTAASGGRPVTAGTVWTDPVASVDLHARWRVRVLNVAILDGTGRTPAPAVGEVSLRVVKGSNDACAGAARADVVCVDHGARLADTGAGAAVIGPFGWDTSGWAVLREGTWEPFDLTGERVRSDLLVSATWVPRGFRVTLLVGSGDVPSAADLAGGAGPWSGSASSTTTVAVSGRLVDALPAGSLTPRATGFTFTGWVCAEGPCPTLDVEATMPAADLTWRATWARDIDRVEYHLALPEGVDADRVRVQAPAQGGTVAYGRTVPVPDGYREPVVDGLDFGGWAVAGGGPAVVPGESLAPATPGGVLDLEAIWSTSALKVTFVLGTAPQGTAADDFGSGPLAVQTADGEAYAVEGPTTSYGSTLGAQDRPADPLAAPYSHVFLGWSRHAVASGPDDFYGFGAADPITADTVLYAQWQRREFTVSFSTNPGNGHDGRPKAVTDAPPASQKVAYGDTVDVVDAPGAEGYWLTGWNTAPDGSGTSFALGDGGTPVTGPVTLYALWGNLRQAVVLGAFGLLGVGSVGGAGWYSLRRRRAPLARSSLPRSSVSGAPLDPAPPARFEVV
ncbi:InlB B-repeat-containing protein [Cellulomonas soli]|uniref:InlB B-repeat-containing protein n=1 Tax=Cellulomonas soli TaxID=931535 RepID=UPI003F838A61